MKKLYCDLCVLGGGGAGLTAAARAATLTDKKIIVVEKGRATGGGACQAGDFRVYGSKWQKDRGLNDNLSADLRKRMDETYWELERKAGAECLFGHRTILRLVLYAFPGLRGAVCAGPVCL